MREELEHYRFASSMQHAADLPSPVEAKACGKAIIVGEHAVVYGAKAVAMPLLHHAMRVKLQPESFATPYQTNAEVKFLVGDKNVPNHVRDVIFDAFKLLNVEPFSLTLRGKSTLPLGAGLGSSVTLCVVVLRVITASLGLKYSAAEIARLANRMEERFHGKPSGLDTSVVSFESIIGFRKGVGAEPLESTHPMRFVVVDSGLRASTLSMIRIAAPFFTGSESEQRLQCFDQIAEQVESGLRDGDHESIADAMCHANGLLSQAGVVPDKLQSIIDGCRDAGALAAKVTGAGGGGSILALLPQRNGAEIAQNIAEVFGAPHCFEVKFP